MGQGRCLVCMFIRMSHAAKLMREGEKGSTGRVQVVMCAHWQRTRLQKTNDWLLTPRTNQKSRVSQSIAAKVYRLDVGSCMMKKRVRRYTHL